MHCLYIHLASMCELIFMLETLCTHMNSRPPNHHMTGLTLIPKQRRGRLTSTKWTTQEDGVASTNILHLRLYHKEANTRIIVSHMTDRKFRQIKTTLQYVHIEVIIFLLGMEEGRI